MVVSFLIGTDVIFVILASSQLSHVSDNSPARLSLRSRARSRKLSDRMQKVKRRIGKNILWQENECVVRFPTSFQDAISPLNVRQLGPVDRG